MTSASLNCIGCRQSHPLLRRLVWAVALFALFAPHLNAEVWRSPLHSLTYVQVEKALRDPFLDAEAAAGLPASEVFLPLPPEVVERLGSQAVDYDSFTATYLPPPAAQELAEIAAQHGLVVVSGIDRRVELPWHAFEAGDANGRIPPGFQGPPQAVRRLYLVQFAYPIREPWLASLPDCGIEPVAYFQQRTLLVRAQSERRLTACPAASYFSWIDSYRTFDRASAPLLETESAEGWDLQFVPGTDLPGKARALPPGLFGEAVDIPPTGGFPRPALLRAKGPAAGLRSFVLADPDLLSVTTRGVGELSDERQGQIIAGNHNGTAPVLTPRYRDWLNSRGLLGAANQQTVCVVDTGYDTGNNPAANGWQRHPDFAFSG